MMARCVHGVTTCHVVQLSAVGGVVTPVFVTCVQWVIQVPVSSCKSVHKFSKSSKTCSQADLQFTTQEFQFT